MIRKRNGNGQFIDVPRAGGLMHWLNNILYILLILLICFPWLYLAWRYLKPGEIFNEFIKESILREGRNLTCFAYKTGHEFCKDE